jgi:hypothetical protein
VSVRVAGMLLAVAGALILAACGEDEPAPPPPIPGAAAAIDDPFSGGYPTYDDEATGLRIVLGTPDIATGTQRVSFALFDRDGLISFPALNVASRYYPEGPTAPHEERQREPFEFHRYPDGARGIYVAHLAFDEPGQWALDIALPRPDGSIAQVLVPLRVPEATSAPAVGSEAPASRNRTLADEPDLARLTTASHPDETLHRVRIADAIEGGRPFVVTFASPAFCTNALCGPQVEVLTELREAHEGAAEFVHVELYENPYEIRGDLSVARRTPVLEEWGLHTDQWTFVVDADGIVRARFEGFTPRAEVEAALLAALERPAP